MGSAREEEYKCVNCGGAHKATSNDCEKYKIGKKIAQLRATTGLTYNEAKNKIQRNTPSSITNGSPQTRNIGTNSTQSGETNYRDALTNNQSQKSTTNTETNS